MACPQRSSLPGGDARIDAMLTLGEEGGRQEF